MKPGYTGDPKDNQAVFNFVLSFIREQAEPAIGGSKGGSNCCYRASGGLLCCAAGCLMPDSDYRPSFDEVWPTGLMVGGIDNEASRYFRGRGFDLSLLTQLQRAHDHASDTTEEELFLDGFERRMQRAAKRFGLTYEAV